MNIDKIRGGLHGYILPFKNIYPDKPCASPIVIDKRKQWRKYRKKVWEMTEKIAHKIEGIEKRGFKTYHIDHKISIWYGFKNGMTPEFIADISNLRMLTSSENLKKGTKNFI